MLKPTFTNILLYLFLKYIADYLFLMFKYNNFEFLNAAISIRNGQDLFYYLWLVLFMPVISILLFSAPIYFSFKIKNIIYFTLLMSIILVAEYFVYVYFTSRKPLYGIINEIISLFFLLLFFFKSIRLIFKQSIL